jgi:hypothetical protein
MESRSPGKEKYRDLHNKMKAASEELPDGFREESLVSLSLAQNRH